MFRKYTKNSEIAQHCETILKGYDRQCAVAKCGRKGIKRRTKFEKLIKELTRFSDEMALASLCKFYLDETEGSSRLMRQIKTLLTILLNLKSPCRALPPRLAAQAILVFNEEFHEQLKNIVKTEGLDGNDIPLAKLRR